MKNGPRNKFLLCFRPIDIDSDQIDYSSDHVLSYIAVSKMVSDSSDSQRKSSFRRSFSGVLKSVIFQTSLSKRPKRLRELSRDELVAVTKTEDDLDSPTSTLCRFPCSSTGFDDLGLSLQHKEEEVKTKEVRRRKSPSMNHVMYLVVVTLWVTVLWGKLFAVVTTTVWIYLVRVLFPGESFEEGGRVGGLWKNVFHLCKNLHCDRTYNLIMD